MATRVPSQAQHEGAVKWPRPGDIYHVISTYPCVYYVDCRFPANMTSPQPTTPHARPSHQTESEGELRRESDELPSDLAVATRSTRTAFEASLFAARHSRAPLLISGPAGSGRRRLGEVVLSEACRAGQAVLGETRFDSSSPIGAGNALRHLMAEVATDASDKPVGVLLEAVEQLSKADQWELCGWLDAEARRPKRRHRIVATAAESGLLIPELRCRLGVWMAHLNPIVERAADVEQAIRRALDRPGADQRRRFTVVPDALELYLTFTTGPRATWPQNFVELFNSVARLVTFASVSGELSVEIVRGEILHLSAYWERQDPSRTRVDRVLADAAQTLDRVDRVALEEVLGVCVSTASMAEAGKLLFARSRERRSSVNDSDRVKKYLTRYGITWADIQRKLAAGDEE